MKTRIFATLSSLALLTAVPAFAQSDAVMNADIPFEFRVGETILPAGHYEVHPQINPGVLLIRCFDCKASAMIHMHAVYTRKMPQAAILKFNRYDETYFLSSVWIPGYPQGREMGQVEGRARIRSQARACCASRSRALPAVTPTVN